MLALVPAVAFLTYVILFTTYQTKTMEGREWKSERRVLEVHKVGRSSVADLINALNVTLQGDHGGLRLDLFVFSQSHASAIERIFTMFFGLGYVAFLVLELITVLEKEPGSDCYNPIRATVCCLNILFVALQGFLIFYYPRLKLNIQSILDR